MVIMITEDALREDVETLTLSLTGPTMGVIAEPDTSTVFIIDETGIFNGSQLAKLKKEYSFHTTAMKFIG